MHNGPMASLEQILASRERRVEKQREWVDAHSLPLVSFTINMVGAVKRNYIAKVAFEQGYQAIINACKSAQLNISKMETIDEITGYELLMVVSGDIHFLKRTVVTIEESHPLGRLFDIDVIGSDYRPLSRKAVNQPTRRCLVCDHDAKSCMRMQHHSTSQLIAKMTELINACQ